MREEEVSFTNGKGRTLAGILHHPGQSRSSAGVILCHGMESNKESGKIVALARALSERGISALRFDFACANEETGKFEEITYSGEVKDLRSAFDFLQARGIGKTAVFGSSMGGTVGVLFAARERRVAALVTLAAPLHPEKITEKLLSADAVEQWREKGYLIYHGRRINVTMFEDLQTIDVPNAAKRVLCPTFVIHGDCDDTVPVREARELFSLLPGEKKLSIVAGADHRLSDPRHIEAALNDTVEWLRRYLQ
jgi:pimeloyl-ACP methyl ester carboxylesterase